MQNQMPQKAGKSSIQLFSARGEAESAQILVFSGRTPIENGKIIASPLTGPDGSELEAETGIVGYVRVKKPTLAGFWKAGYYPDPILPKDDFSVKAGQNQAIWYSVWVPGDAKPGLYSGSLEIIIDGGQEITVPVELNVFNTALPVTSFLKTSMRFWEESNKRPEYYGENWSQSLADELPWIGLKYRFTHRVDLPLMEALEPLRNGSGPAQWDEFDRQAEFWLENGISCFELKLPIRWSLSPDRIEADWGSRLAAIDEHLVERGWNRLFYYYFYDEPFPNELKDFNARLKAIKKYSPNIHNVLTYGVTKKGEKTALGSVGIWVPNIHQFDEKFARSRQALGEEYWIYTCVGNIVHYLPDNFRIDWYGEAHRALGWWLFKYNIDGYLYWAVDLWRRNPWETSETFPWTNGDGMMFYPALDGKSQIYPSTRVHLMRDAFEDFDLLTMLKEFYERDGEKLEAGLREEIEKILSVNEIIFSKGKFELDGQKYIDTHRRILEILDYLGGLF